MTKSYANDLMAINWRSYDTAFGNAESVPDILLALIDEDDKRAFQAADDLESFLCHQHNQLGSASLPALPFMFEVLADCSDGVAGGVLYALWGFAYGTEPYIWTVERPAWVADLKRALRRGESLIEAYVDHPDEDFRCYAQETLKILRTQVPEECDHSLQVRVEQSLSDMPEIAKGAKYRWSTPE